MSGSNENDSHVPRIPKALPGDKRSGMVRWLEALKAGEIKGGPG